MLLILVATACLLSGCGSDDGPSKRSEASPVEPSESAGAAANVWVNGGECTDASTSSLGSKNGCVSQASGDVDGDGAPDAIYVFALVDDDLRPEHWKLRVATASAGWTQRLDAGNPFSYPRVVGIADVHDDGRGDVFVKMNDLASHGTPWQSLAVWTLAGRRLVPLKSDGELLPVRVGGISRMGEGAACTEDGFTIFRTWALDRQNLRWRVVRRVFEIHASRAEQVGRTTEVLRLENYNDPRLDEFYRVTCGDLTYSA